MNADGVEAGAQSYPFLIGRFVSSNTLAALRYLAVAYFKVGRGVLLIIPGES